MFSDSATFKVLRALFSSPEPVSLRELAYRSNLQVRSVQLVVEKALESFLIVISDEGYRKFYILNVQNSEYAPLRAYFTTLDKQDLKESSKLLKNADAVFSRTNELVAVMKQLREVA